MWLTGNVSKKFGIKVNQAIEKSHYERFSHDFILLRDYFMNSNYLIQNLILNKLIKISIPAQDFGE